METDELRATVEAFCSAWSARDQAALTRLWDDDDPACSYLPARSEQRLIGAAAVQAFIARTLSTFAVIRMRPRSLHVRRLGEALGAAFAEVDWALKGAAAGPPLGGTIRVSAVLRRHGGRWRLAHYAEAPLAPLVELRRFYQKVAADGHEALS